MWDFSNNIDITWDLGCKDGWNGCTIYIRYADISFDTTLNTHRLRADVSNQLPRYNFYKLDKRTTSFMDKAAIEISNNRYPPM